MAFIRDLDPCSYIPLSGDPPLVAVGWLEDGHPFATGDPGLAVRARLDEYVQRCWQPIVFMGAHTCSLCGTGYFHRNLFVPGRGVTYAAPAGIVHYIERHHYCPPAAFCEALLQSPPVDSAEYFAALWDVGWSQVLGRFYRQGPVVDQGDHPGFVEELRRIRDGLREASGKWPARPDLVMLSRPWHIPAVFWTFDPAYAPLRCTLRLYVPWIRSDPTYEPWEAISECTAHLTLVKLDGSSLSDSQQPESLAIRRRFAGGPLPATLADSDIRGVAGAFVLLAEP